MVLNIVTREEWNAMPPKYVEIMTLPVKNVVFTIENNVEHCLTREDCIKGVKDIQNYYSDIGLDDLPYSFLVGNDGNIYEGRGWKHKPGPHIQRDEEFQDQTIEIGIMCGYEDSTPDVVEKVIAAYRTAKAFVESAVEADFVVKDYVYHGFSDELLEGADQF